MVNISVVVPLYNEEDNVAEGYQEITGVLSGMKSRKEIGEYEIIYVDDGSRDATISRLWECVRFDPCVKIVEFRRNFGQTAAMSAGLDHAQYEVVATLDGDLQNDPAEIPQMLKKLAEGYDMVAGWRKRRQDGMLLRKIPSKIANWLISRTTRVKLHDYGCTLKLMTQEVARGIKMYGEMHRFIPALADVIGARIVEVPVNHRARKHGTSKYGISRTLRVVLDLITVKFLLGFQKRPIHLFGTIGLVSTIFGSTALAWITLDRFINHVPMGNRPVLTLSVMLILIGLQFLVFGLLAEVLARTYYESQDKKTYTVRRVHAAMTDRRAVNA